MKYQLLYIFLMGSILTYAQSPRAGYFNKTKIGTPERLKTEPDVINEGSGLEIHNINGWHFFPKFSAGIGISAVGYVNPTVSTYPVYVHALYHLKDQIKTPFVYGNSGYSIALKSFKGGALMEAGIGYNFKLGKKTSFVPEIGYRVQELKDKYRNKLTLQSLTIGFGFIF